MDEKNLWLECTKAIAILRKGCADLDGLPVEKQSCPEDMALWAITAIREARAPDPLAAKLAEAIRDNADWKMRDGTPCYCPLGEDEDEPDIRPTTQPCLHASNCEGLRAALAEYDKEKNNGR